MHISIYICVHLHYLAVKRFRRKSLSCVFEQLAHEVSNTRKYRTGVKIEIFFTAVQITECNIVTGIYYYSTLNKLTHFLCHFLLEKFDNGQK